MQSVRDTIKESIKYTLEQLGQSVLLQDKLYAKFIKEHKLMPKHLNRLLNPQEYKLKNKNPKSILLPALSKDELYLIRKLGEIYSLTLADILGDSRSRDCADARRLYMVILYYYMNNKLVKVALKTNRDHTTIINAIRRHDNLIESDAEYREIFFRVIDELKLELPDAFKAEYRGTITELDKRLTQEKWDKMGRLLKDMKNKGKKFEKANQYT